MRAWGRYFKMDLSRLFRSPQFYIASAGVFAVFMASSGQAVGSANVYDLYYFLKIYSTTIVVYACSNFAYANSLLEDWEHGLFRVAVLRGNLKSYVCAKACCCFLAALLSVTAGILAFVSAESARLPLMMDTDASMLPYIRDNGIDIFGFLLRKDRILLYFACSSMMIGILGGALALFAMWLSLVAKNKMFAVCIPVAAALSACFTALLYRRMKQMASGIRQ